MSTNTKSDQSTDRQDSSGNRVSDSKCTTCGEQVAMYPVGTEPLILKGCGCGLTLEYSPIVESGGSCPICALIEDHGIKDFGQDVTHTHVQSIPVHGTGGTEPVADKGTRPPRAATSDGEEVPA